MSQASTAPPSADVLEDKPLPPRPPRVRPLRTAADVDAVPYFDDEEKRVATATLVRSVVRYGAQPTITVCTSVHDPLAAAARFAYGQDLDGLLQNIGQTRHTTLGSLLNLLVLTVLRHVGDECLIGAISAGKGVMVPGFKHHHYALMDFPESEVWSPDQRLMLRYAKALLNDDVTDELWREAVDAWGVRQCLRYIQFMGRFWTAGVIDRTLRVPHPMYRDALS